MVKKTARGTGKSGDFEAPEGFLASFGRLHWLRFEKEWRQGVAEDSGVPAGGFGIQVVRAAMVGATVRVGQRCIVESVTTRNKCNIGAAGGGRNASADGPRWRVNCRWVTRRH